MGTSAIVLTGAPGVGKSTVAALLAHRLPRAAHVEADELHRMIVSGGEWPSAGTGEAFRQLLLRTRNAAQLAANFSEAAITPIVDEVIATDDQLAIVDEILGGSGVVFVVLAAPSATLLARDAGRGKHTASNYMGVAAMVEAVLAGRATFLDSTHLSPEDTATAIQELLPDLTRT